jgi:hypothetical protein
VFQQRWVLSDGKIKGDFSMFKHHAGYNSVADSSKRDRSSQFISVTSKFSKIYIGLIGSHIV